MKIQERKNQKLQKSIITVRLDGELHQSLKQEVRRLSLERGQDISLNQLCIAKLREPFKEDDAIESKTTDVPSGVEVYDGSKPYDEAIHGMPVIDAMCGE